MSGQEAIFRIDQRLLARCQIPPEEATPQHCRHLAADFGGLACWMLHPTVLARAAQEWTTRFNNPQQGELLKTRPSLPFSAGSCWVVFVASRKYPLLREAFVIPFRWYRLSPKANDNFDAECWERELPLPLIHECRSVLQLMHAYKSSGERSQPTDWLLRLAVDAQPERYDLTKLADDILGTSSAWASLAAGWLIAARRGTVNPSVWASACWGENGLQMVDGLEGKVRLAHEWGATRFYVAHTQSRMDFSLPSGIRLCDLRGGTANPLQALQPLAQDLAVQPHLPDDWQEWAEPKTSSHRQTHDEFYRATSAYHAFLRSDLADPLRAGQFYGEVVLPPIVEKCRRQLQTQQRELLGTRGGLVTILSGSPELVELATQVLRPRRCLVLYTEETEDKLQSAQERICRGLPDCEYVWSKINRKMRPDNLPPCVEAFVRVQGNKEVVVDLTPGTKLMTLALSRLGDCGCRRLYFMTEQRASEIQFGTYEVVLV